MNFDKLGMALLLSVCLGCGDTKKSGDDISSDQPNATSQEQLNGINESEVNFDYIEESDNGMKFLEMNIIELAGSNDISDSNTSKPLDVYPNAPFEFQWKLESDVVVFANSFLVLKIDDREIPVFATIMNPLDEILANKATCIYDNENMLICDLVQIPQHIGAKVPTDFSETFNSLPMTVEVLSTICSITRGCDKIRLGYIRFN